MLNGELTCNQPDLTGRLLIGTGHHGSHCIIHNSHDIQVKFLQRDREGSTGCHLSLLLLLIMSYLSPLNSLPQQSNHILSFTVCSLESFSPCNKDTLQTQMIFQTIEAYCCHLTNKILLWG